VKSYAGYVRLPPSVLSDVGNYTINTFFWYFEARNNPRNAPLSIYLAGGPGDSSTFAAADGESGPCLVNADANSTSINPFSFNNHVNMLYIDQPVQTGFSYDSLINGTFDYSYRFGHPRRLFPRHSRAKRHRLPRHLCKSKSRYYHEHHPHRRQSFMALCRELAE
jgi:hypothetical protein